MSKVKVRNTGGNNLPLVAQEDAACTLTAADHHAVFARQRCDKFQEGDMASTQSDRQCKDATDLIFQETMGASTASGSKGINAQYVSADKLVLGPSTEPSEAVPLGRGGGRKQGDVSPQGRVERRGLCFDEPPLLIRRLTPRECERLQGFPDDWTALPGAADAPRYRALGNSVAIPCVEYLMHGMALVLRAS